MIHRTLICLAASSLVIVLCDGASTRMYEPLHYTQCIYLPARLPNKTQTTMPMMTCPERHRGDGQMLELLRRKESLILDQFNKQEYNNALRVIYLLYLKTHSEGKVVKGNNVNYSNKGKKTAIEKEKAAAIHRQVDETLYVVFIGDSMSKQSYFAFICELEFNGAVPRAIDDGSNDTVKQFIQSHKNYKDLIRYDKSVVYNVDHNHFEHKYIVNYTTFQPISHKNETVVILLHTVFIWRNKGGSGSILNDAYNNEYANRGVSRQTDNSKIMQPFISLYTKYFNLKTLTIYNEGLHHHVQEAFSSALSYPLGVFQSLSGNNGPFFIIRESNALHFQVISNNDTFQAANLSAKKCVQTRKDTKKWRNQMLYTQWRTTSRTFFVPFYASTTIWEDDLHFFPDCLHPGCYTPFYWLSLFDAIYQVLSGENKNKWFNRLHELYDQMLHNAHRDKVQ